MAQQPTGSGTAQGKGPGLLRMAMSATKAMANYVGSGFKTATPEVQRQRLQTCAACEHHTGLRCQICGCFTNVKSRLLHEDCPDRQVAGVIPTGYRAGLIVGPNRN